MTLKVQIRCKFIDLALLYQNFVCYWSSIMSFGQKWVKIRTIPSFHTGKELYRTEYQNIMFIFCFDKKYVF